MARRKRETPKEERRGKGDGSIGQRPNGTWRGYLTTGYGPKGATRKYYYGKTYAEVRDKIAAGRETLRKNLPIPEERQTLGQFLEVWLETSARQRLRPNTFASYEDTITRHIIPELGRTALAKLTPQQVQSLLAKKQVEEALSARSCQYIRALLRVALNQALRWGLVSRNVASLAEAPRVQRYEVTPLTPEQAQAFLKAAEADRLAGLFTLALTTGLRRGELLGLRWADVDLEKGTLRVVKTLQRVDGKPQLVEPKTERSRRTITLPQLAVNALRAHRTRQLEDRMLAGPLWQESGLVFASTVGTPLEGANVNHRFHRLMRRAGLEAEKEKGNGTKGEGATPKPERKPKAAGNGEPRVRFHDLRHTCASFLLAQGLPARMVMEVLGHSQIGTTMDIYAHILPAMHQEAASQMDALLGT